MACLPLVHTTERQEPGSSLTITCTAIRAHGSAGELVVCSGVNASHTSCTRPCAFEVSHPSIDRSEQRQAPPFGGHSRRSAPVREPHTRRAAATRAPRAPLAAPASPPHAPPPVSAYSRAFAVAESVTVVAVYAVTLGTSTKPARLFAAGPRSDARVGPEQDQSHTASGLHTIQAATAVLGNAGAGRQRSGQRSTWVRAACLRNCWVSCSAWTSCTAAACSLSAGEGRVSCLRADQQDRTALTPQNSTATAKLACACGQPAASPPTRNI